MVNLLKEFQFKEKKLVLHTLDEPKKLDFDKSEEFVCVVFNNMNSSDGFDDLVESIISSQCSYVCCAGVECEKLHDQIDMALVMQDVVENKGEFVMTTWHEDESVEEVLDFALNQAGYDDIKYNEYKVVLIGKNELMEKRIVNAISK